MKVIITLILSAFLLTSCSNPDTSGGVTLHKFGPRPADARDCWPQCPQEEPEPDEANNTKEPEPDPPTTTDEFPHGLCTGPTELGDKSQTTGCGYLSAHGSRYYIMPYAKLYWAYLRRATLIGANLSGAKLGHANLRWPNLRDANLSYAILRDADLNHAYLRDANLYGADLTDADLSNADLYGADLSGANLSGTKGNQYTVCPNGHIRSNSGNNCGF